MANVFVSYFRGGDTNIGKEETPWANLNKNDNFILYVDETGKSKLSIQIIRRLYICPYQIIAGFDVDCCCILSNLDGQIYATERGVYAISGGYNVVNFDRLSPSYEYRLVFSLIYCERFHRPVLIENQSARI